MKHFLFLLSTTVFILLACANSSIISEGCRSGIYLWYNSIIPVILPFMLISAIILERISTYNINTNTAVSTALIIGLMCGFPTGTIVISHFYKKGILKRNTAQCMLPVCNNVSPMFLYAYIYRGYLSLDYTMAFVALYIYIPQLIYMLTALSAQKLLPGIFGYRKRRISSYSVEGEAACCNNEKGSEGSKDSLLTGIVTNISIIGIYIVIFSIITMLIQNYLKGTFWSIIAAYMEISKGIPILFELSLDGKIKTALILSLTSFGGLSALFQSRELIKESRLSFVRYIADKLICSILSYTAVLLFIH